MTKQQYIEEVARLVKKYAPRFGIKVYSPIIAQFCLECGYGTSNKVKKVLEDGTIDWRHNYAGLKWRNNRCAVSNEYFEEDTAEQNKDGSYVGIVSKFYRFKSLEDCVIGYFQFTNISAYANLKGVTDPEQYLINIKADKYATSIDYVQKNMNVINEWNLTKYDPVNQTSQGENKMSYKIAIDAGHGSNTAGKRTLDGYKEHEINVDVADFLEDELLRCGFEVFKVAWDDADATDDPDVALSTRQAQIKSEECDASVSCHANAHGDGKTYTTGQGVETLIHNNTAYVGDSRTLAEKVQSHLIKNTAQKNRGVKTQSLAMCNCVAMGTKASILVEIGFMTNEYESTLMKTQEFCLECAQEIAQGICEYFGVNYIKGNVVIPSTSTTPNSSTTIIRNYLMKGDKGDEVKELQENLNYIGYSCGTADGIFGAKTNTALRKFQTVYKLTVDGKYGANSKEKLESLVSQKKASASKSATSNSSSISVSSGKYIYNGVNYTSVFNPTYYANKYADLKKAFGSNTTKLFEHFCKYGMNEKRMGCQNFNVDVYKNNYADLRKTFGNDVPAYYKHYCQYGYKENRKAI